MILGPGAHGGPHGPYWALWGPIGPYAALRECAKRNLHLSWAALPLLAAASKFPTLVQGNAGHLETRVQCGPHGAPMGPRAQNHDFYLFFSQKWSPGPPQRSPVIFGFCRIFPDLGPEPASGHGPRNLAPEPPGLATEPSELATEPSGLATDPSGLATDPSGRVSGLTSGVWTDIGCLDWGRMSGLTSGVWTDIGCL